MYPIPAIQEAPGDIISGGFVLFGRHFAMKAILAFKPSGFGYSTIASGTVRTHLFASGRFCSADASVFAISASAITDANSAIE